MNHASSTTSRSGCGCGGSTGVAMRPGNISTSVAKRGGGCSCGGSCGGCQGQDFVRPRFFAGQLLTEDDLGLLGSYVVEKNRLHNRYFWGEGVVCGLMVTCDPCGGGNVTVQSGYALDCCGNDIVVSCPQTLDINALVRRLRIERTGGVDCGDPCADLKASGVKPPVPPPADDTKRDDKPPPLAPAEYCLYVKYCESATDPVTPYATDDPCGAQACEATRIREGFTFELRCRSCEEPVPDNLFTRIGDCLGDLRTAERTASEVRTNSLYAMKLAPALDRAAANQPAALFTAGRLEEVNVAGARISALPKKPVEWTSAQALEATEAAETLASFTAAWHTTSESDLDALPDRDTFEAAAAVSKRTLGQLAGRQPAIEARVALLEDPHDRTLAEATTTRALLWAKPEEAVKVVPPGELALASAGTMYSSKANAAMANSLARIKANLIERLEARGPLTDCTLLRDVKAVTLPDDSSGNANIATARLSYNASQRSTDLLLRYLRECICAALNPPCISCDDSAVLLACLRVDGCDVVDICNFERTFVLTPVTTRYWLPFLKSIGDAIERACCPSDRCEPPKKEADLGDRRVRVTTLNLSRAHVERSSAAPMVSLATSPTMRFDPARIAALLPARLRFSGTDARRLAVTSAAVLDLATLRYGMPVGDVIAPALAPFLATPVAEEPPADVADLKRQVVTMKTKLDAAERLTAKLDARLARLEKTP